MKKLLIIIIITMITILPSILGNSSSELNINEYKIDIIKQNERILIKEDIIIQGNNNGTYTNILIWIKEFAQDIKFNIFGDEIDYLVLGNDKYSVNISSYNISKNSIISLNVSYFIEEDFTEFKKILLYDTSLLSIKFNDENIFSGYDLSNNSEILISLFTPSEAPISIYLFVSIFLILLLALIITYYIFKKQKKTKIKNITGESKELLSTKKVLLMSILKQLEKEYRAKKISDDTYNKLRDLYKQEAVESMKKLEDIESETI